MKKYLFAILMFIMLFTLTACNNGSNTEEITQSTVREELEQNETTVVTEAVSDTQAQSETADNSTEATGVKSLVVYFSATGNTKAVAEVIASNVNADIYEIKAKEPYTDDDLSYSNDDCRANLEHNDSNARPEIEGNIENLEQYDVVYVGYPIWWGDMPRIMYTFFDTYDFNGKIIAPFCTSGGSGLSGTPDTITEMETGATVVDGLQIGTSSTQDSEEQVTEWLKTIGQN